VHDIKLGFLGAVAISSTPPHAGGDSLKGFGLKNIIIFIVGLLASVFTAIVTFPSG